MLIKQIRFKNYKTFYGTQTIDLLPTTKPDDETDVPNIVLIGGLNGAGKTTILNAIWYSFFGTNGRTKDEISKSNANIINDLAFTEGSREAHLSLFIQKDKEEWEIEVKFYINNEKKVSMEERFIHIKKDGQNIRKKITFNSLLEFIRYTNTLIPQYAAPFFIFDGEKISNLIKRQDTNQMVSAINTITGADAYKTLIADLTKLGSNLEKEIAKSTKQANVEQAFKDLEKNEIEYNAFNSKLLNLQREISDIENELSATKLKRRTKLQQNNNSRTEVAKKLGSVEINLLTETNNFDDQFTNNAIGILLRNKINNLKSVLQQEKKQNEDELMRTRALNPLYDFINSTIAEEIDPPLTTEQIEQIRSKGEDWYSKQFNIKSTTKLPCLHDVTNSEFSLISNYQSSSIETLKTAQTKINSLKSQINQYELELSNAPDEIDAGVENQLIDQLNKKQLALSTQLPPLKAKVSSLKEIVSRQKSQYTKISAKTTSGSELINELDQINRTLAAIETHVRELTNYKKEMVKIEFENMLRSLLRKQNEFSQIEFDLESAKIKLFNSQQIEIDLDSRSAGEKQMISSALIWALTRVSYLNLPIIIDTPLGRLDSKHRRTLIENFYKYLGEQVIILSTDTEFDQNYLEVMEKVSYKQYTLDYNEDRKYTVIRDGYFNFEKGGI